MFLARLGCDVLCSDVPSQLSLLQHNVEANFPTAEDIRSTSKFLGECPTVVPLEWGDEAHLSALNQPIDVIVGSDITYFPKYFDVLVKTLLYLCTADTRVVIGHTYRLHSDEVKLEDRKKGSGFFDKLEAAGFQVTVVRASSPLGLDAPPKLGDTIVVEAFRLEK